MKAMKNQLMRSHLLITLKLDKEKKNKLKKSNQVIPLEAPNTQLIKLSDGQYYLKQIDIRTNQSIMINLNEIHLINFRDKEIEMKPTDASSIEPQVVMHILRFVGIPSIRVDANDFIWLIPQEQRWAFNAFGWRAIGCMGGVLHRCEMLQWPLYVWYKVIRSGIH